MQEICAKSIPVQYLHQSGLTWAPGESLAFRYYGPEALAHGEFSYRWFGRQASINCSAGHHKPVFRCIRHVGKSKPFYVAANGIAASLRTLLQIRSIESDASGEANTLDTPLPRCPLQLGQQIPILYLWCASFTPFRLPSSVLAQVLVIDQ
ncbi:hypothetical protein NUW58_g5213 [Xylaria curta]|uniref:Uncharacterized protein n=1 Tax=Xylaria curta TaxID=42375 RepID=A0ACC1P4B5_9PEZI|nr:hypothetical protein NUW58_g5213 [Xylaria curta]